MKILKISTLVIAVLFLNSCASVYKPVNPEGLKYNSISTHEEVSLEYKYDLLDKKYQKKEQKRDVRLVAVKVTNNSNKDLIFGDDIRLTYENGGQLLLLEREKVFKELKQQPATYLFYLPLTLLSVSFTKESSDYSSYQTTSTIPVGLILGPALAGGNLYQAAKSNKKFRADLDAYLLQGRRIAPGETVYGLIGLRANNYDALKIHIPDTENAKKKENITR